jgi:hypothetical protein
MKRDCFQTFLYVFLNSGFHKKVCKKRCYDNELPKDRLEKPSSS